MWKARCVPPMPFGFTRWEPTADGKPGYDGRFRLRRTEEGFWSDFFTVAKARAQYCPSCKMVFAPVVRTDED